MSVLSAGQLAERIEGLATKLYQGDFLLTWERIGCGIAGGAI